MATRAGKAGVQVTPEELVQAGDREGLARLFERLGYVKQALEILPETYSAWGFREKESEQLTGASLVAGKAGFRVLLLEVRKEPTTAWLQSVVAGRFRRDRSARELIVVATAGFRELIFCTRCVGQEPLRVKKLLVRRAAPFKTDLEAIGELALDASIRSASAAGFQVEAALDRGRVTDRFFAAFRTVLRLFKERVTGLPAGTADREAKVHRFCLLTLNRLVFLYFIQKKGWLNGDRAFLPGLVQRAKREGQSLFGLLRILFFGVMNTPAGDRSKEAVALGRFPYLNGGLFEPDAVERSHPEIAMDDASLEIAFDRLFEKFRFTVREDSELEQEVGVDPEMLGKVFENLMDAEERGVSGSFYTPREVVTGMVRGALSRHVSIRTGLSMEAASGLIERGESSHFTDEQARVALDALEGLRVLDPAVGSGAFLLGMLSELGRAQEALSARLGLAPQPGWRRRRRILHRSLYGVDIKGTAVKLCDLRLWLALTVDMIESVLERVPPLPNLDHKVKQGNTLLSWLDRVDFSTASAVHDRLRERMAGLSELKTAYEAAAGPSKRAAASALATCERRIALDFLDWKLGVLGERLAGIAPGRDLFGKRTGLSGTPRREQEQARRQRREIESLRRRLVAGGDLPAFSFEVHFAEALAEGGFDIVIGNPPWVRLGNVAQADREALAARYRSMRKGGSRGLGSTGQLDLAALFLERSMELTKSGGILSLLVPSKLTGALYGSAVRQSLQESWQVVSLADHSLAREKLFRADTFPLIVTAVKQPAPVDHAVQVELHAGRAAWRSFELPQSQLPVPRGESSTVGDVQTLPGVIRAVTAASLSGAPWFLAPPEVRQMMARMRKSRGSLGDCFRPWMGFKTGDNGVRVVEDCAPARRADRVLIRTAGFEEAAGNRSAYSAEVERSAVRPLIRGEGLEPWRASISSGLLWPDPAMAMPALERFLRRHGAKAIGAARSDRPFVVWKDIARRMSATAVVGPMEGPAGEAWPIPLNSTNFVLASDANEAHLITGLLNATPVRAYVAGLVPRAKDGYFRFPCWAVALLPLPVLDSDPKLTARITELARLAAAGQPDDEALDRAVSDAYGLDAKERLTAARWLDFLTAR